MNHVVLLGGGVLRSFLWGCRIYSSLEKLGVAPSISFFVPRTQEMSRICLQKW